MERLTLYAEDCAIDNLSIYHTCNQAAWSAHLEKKTLNVKGSFLQQSLVFSVKSFCDESDVLDTEYFHQQDVSDRVLHSQ